MLRIFTYIILLVIPYMALSNKCCAIHIKMFGLLSYRKSNVILMSEIVGGLLQPIQGWGINYYFMVFLCLINIR